MVICRILFPYSDIGRLIHTSESRTLFGIDYDRHVFDSCVEQLS